jgi:ribosomal protein S27E
MISGAVAQAIARGKNRNQNAWFAAGVLFVGAVLVVALLPKLPDPAPDGMIAEKCPRCNAEQNVPENAPSFTCWRCRYEARLIGMPGTAAELPQARPALPPPGWYQDPANPDQHRYWDGARWSDRQPAGKSAKVRCVKCQHVQVAPRSQAIIVCEQCKTKLTRLTKSAKADPPPPPPLPPMPPAAEPREKWV